MLNLQKNGQLSNDSERAAKLREVLELLRDVNQEIPVIVEGKRDSAALRELGLSGEIITMHRGKSLYDFCEEISENFNKVVILLDWDDKGETLNKTLCGLLGGQWEAHAAFREILKILCQKDIKDIEGIPKLLRRLETDETHRQ